MQNLGYFQPFYQDLIEYLQEPDNRFTAWGENIESELKAELVDRPHGDMERWQVAFEALPNITPKSAHLNQSAVELQGDIESQTHVELKAALKGLMPWRKGPFQFFDVPVDTEWRSDWKWERIKDHISPLKNRTILDVGCGSGYHMWRMYGEGAARVIGVDPSKLFLWQFEAVKKYVKAAQGVESLPVHFLPFKMEDLPKNMRRFDTVFSMGVLYHRRSPLDHLSELKSALRTGGQVVLETLVIEGEEGEVLMPEDRYAMMRNVWFLPSVPTLMLWMRRLGFKNVRLAEQNYTTMEEQRSTDWMGFSSLKDFLDPNDSSKTVEGLPAPLRATIVAEAP